MRGLAATIITGALLLICPALSSAASQHSSARRPIVVRTTASRSVQFGLASWYGPGLQNRLTASGTRFDQYQLTAAHRTLPLGTSVRVTNLKNGRSVILKVTDRGPWVRTRVIDVSRAAAERLGFTHRGVTRVKVAVIHAPAHPAPAPAPAPSGTVADRAE